MISVIIVTYNEEKNIKECLDSIIKQSQKSNEIILVDDGSTDNTLKIASTYPIKIIKTQHQERSHARNIGWKNASGKYILFAEADSIFSENWIKEIMKKFQEGANAVIDRRKMYQPKTLFQKIMDIQFNIRYTNYKPFSAWAFKKSVLQDVGGFNEDLNQSEDTELGKRILDKDYKILLADQAIQYHQGEPKNLIEYLKRAFMIETRRVGIYYKKFPGEKPLGKLVSIIISITLITLSIGWPILWLLFVFYIITQYIFILFKIIFREKGLKSAGFMHIILLAFFRLLRNYSAAAGYIIGNL